VTARHSRPTVLYALFGDRRGRSLGTPLDPSLSVQPSGAPPVTRRHGDGGHGGALVRGSLVVPSEAQRRLQVWERIGNAGSLQPGMPGACEPLTCPKLVHSRWGSGLRTAPPTSASPALTPGLTWSFAWWQVQGSNLGRLSRRFYRPAAKPTVTCGVSPYPGPVGTPWERTAGSISGGPVPARDTALVTMAGNHSHILPLERDPAHIADRRDHARAPQPPNRSQPAPSLSATRGQGPHINVRRFCQGVRPVPCSVAGPCIAVMGMVPGSV
jgi:hypothetical protein